MPGFEQQNDNQQSAPVAFGGSPEPKGDTMPPSKIPTQTEDVSPITNASQAPPPPMTMPQAPEGTQQTAVSPPSTPAGTTSFTPQVPAAGSTEPLPEKRSKFKLIIGILIVLTLIIYAVVGYLYYQNQGAKSDKEESTAQLTPVATPTETPLVYTYEIENGSVVKTSSTGGSEVIIAKDDHESTGIVGFTNVVLSPNEENICFWSLPPALEPGLYYSTATGSAVTLIREKVKNCLWSYDGTKVAYEDDTAQNVEALVYIYDRSTNKEISLTDTSTVLGIYRRYNIDSWLENDSKLLCSYEEVNNASPGASVEGTCEINALSGKVTDL